MRLRFWNPREAAQEVLLHLGWTQEAGTPTRVFPFGALRLLALEWPPRAYVISGRRV